MERLTANDLNKTCYDPWELCGMDSYCKKGCHEEGGCTKGCHILKMYRKLAEYEELEEQGRFLKLPCTVGDTVFEIYEGEIIERIVRGILFRGGELWGQDGNGSDFGIFGKTVFLTRPEAERALAEMEGKK